MRWTRNTGWYANPDERARVIAPAVRTRHQPPGRWSKDSGDAEVYAIAAYTVKQEMQAAAIHEAGHAVVWMAAGHRIDYITVPPRHTPVAPNVRALVQHQGGAGPWQGFAAAAAAGERATDRWLRETGLWTSDRAWAAERVADHDRVMAAGWVHGAVGTAMTFGASAAESDYTSICNTADNTLAAFWNRVTALGRHLAEHHFATGVEAARIAGFDPLTHACNTNPDH
jgi:hypothetical protein